MYVNFKRWSATWNSETQAFSLACDGLGVVAQNIRLEAVAPLGAPPLLPEDYQCAASQEERASGFHMEILAYDVYWNEDYAVQHGIRYAEPAEIFKECDFISLHLPLTEQTYGIVNEAALSQMKKNAVLINTARGELIDEDALVKALQNGQIAAAGLDVFREEPPKNPALYGLENLIMGAHCAASTQGASIAMSRMATENIVKALTK